MKKRFIAVFMAIVMMVCLFPFNAFASEINGNNLFENDMVVVQNIFEDGHNQIEESEKESSDKSETTKIRIIAKVVSDIAKALTKDASTLPLDISETNINNVTDLGDSTIFGYALDDMAGPKTDAANGYGMYSVKSFPAYVAAALSLSNYYKIIPGVTKPHSEWGVERAYNSNNELAQLGLPGMRTSEARYLLEDGRVKDGDSESYFNNWDTKYGLHMEEQKDIYRNRLSESDLVTISFGGNDISHVLMGALSADTDLWEYFKADQLFSSHQIKSMKATADKISEVLNKLQLDSDTVKTLNSLATAIILIHGSFSEHMPMIVEDVHRLNPNAKIAIMGVFNPVDLYYQTDEDDPTTKVDLTLLFDALFSRINYLMRNIAVEHPDYCGFIDCSKVEMGFSASLSSHNIAHYENGISGLIEAWSKEGGDNWLMKLSHQSPAGHHDTYTRLMKALNLKHHTHHLECVVETESTCTKEGSAYYVCIGSLCSDNEIECGEDEYNHEGCGLHFKDEWGQEEGSFILPAKGHQFDQWTRVNEETHQRVCADCGNVETAKHDFNADNICKQCGYSQVTGQIETGIVNNNTYIILSVILLLCLAACFGVVVYKRNQKH